MALEPGGEVGEQGEAGGVRFGEAVFAKTFDLPVDGFGEFQRVTTLGHALDQPFAQMAEAALALPGGHRAAQVVGLAGREAGGDDGELHHLFLEDRHAERALEDAFDGGRRVGNRLDTLTPAQVGMHHVALDRAGADDGDFDYEVVETLRFQARQHDHLRARFDLEDADGVGAADHGVGRRVFARDVLHAEDTAVALRDGVERAANRGEHAKGEDVDLHQLQRIDVVLVPLDDAARFHRRVLDRHQPVEAAAADDEAADVLREMARKTAQLLGEDQPLLDARTRRVEADGGKARRHLVALVPPGERGGERVDAVEVDAERPAGVAQRRAAAIADDGGGQRRAFAPVLGVQVLDDFLAPLVLEVDVDVGRFVAFLGDEALEEQRRLRRVDLGDAERVAHRRIGGRTASLAEDFAAAGEGDDVVDGEEVGFVAQLGDQREFVFDLLPHLVGHAGRVAHEQAAFDLAGEIGARRLAGRDDFLGVFVAQLVERKMALRRNDHGLGEQLGRVEVGQAQARAQMAFAVGEERVAGAVDRGLEAQCGEQVLQRPAAAHVHVHVAGSDQRQVVRGGEAAQDGEALVVVRMQQAFVGDPQAAGEGGG